MIADPTRQKERAELSEKLGYTFSDSFLLDKALTHSSFANEYQGDEKLKNNERLEFLGDAALDLIVAHYLFKTHPTLSEGALSRIRAQVVQEKTLADIARQIELGSYLRLGRGEELSHGREKNSLLADALEAIIAAVYLDSSFGDTDKVFLPFFIPLIDRAAEEGAVGDAKGELQVIAQARSLGQVVYRLIDETGPDHEKTFTIQVSVGEADYAIGVGRSKKEAEQQAANTTLVTLS